MILLSQSRFEIKKANLIFTFPDVVRDAFGLLGVYLNPVTCELNNKNNNNKKNIIIINIKII